MRQRAPYVWFTLLAVLAGVVLCLAAGCGSAPKQQASLPGGKKAAVDPISSFPEETAEGRPDINVATYRLSVGGLVTKPLSLSFIDIKALPSVERFVKLPCVEGWTRAAVWKGPRLSDVLERAGVRKGATTVVFASPGGYTTSLTLADIKSTDPILAYDANGAPLPEKEGYPLRLVAPDKLGYKWIKWVISIKLIKGAYEGYWESRGYSNDAGAKGR